LQWLLGRLVEFVDENVLEAGAGGVLELAARQGEYDLSGEAGGQEHGRPVRDVPGPRRGQEHDPHVGLAVGAVLVREPGRRPGDPVGGNDRRTPIGLHGQDAARGVHQVPLVVGLDRAGAA
jgi:hypothetical protein